MRLLPHIRLLVTHPGGSHRDEWLGCALILGRLLEQGIRPSALPSIERREPTSADLADSGVWVLDIGGVHDADKGNFDHHQFTIEDTSKHPRCTFSLILEYLGCIDDMASLLPWVSYSAAADCLGREQAAATLGIPAEAVSATESPIESGMLSQFSRVQSLAASDPLHIVMSETGQYLLGQAARLRDRVSLLEQQSEEILVHSHLVMLVDMPELQAPQFGLSQFRKRMLQRGVDVAAMVLPDSRGPGYILVRLHDAAPFDFRRLHGESETGFVHASGFLLALRERPARDRLEALLCKAVGR